MCVAGIVLGLTIGLMVCMAVLVICSPGNNDNDEEEN